VARLSIRTALPDVAVSRVEEAEELAAAAVGRLAECSDRVRELAIALRGAHAVRSSLRDRLEERQREAEGATARLRELLGPRSAARRIPLFEKGLAVARLRGDDSTLRGWLTDAADLYVEVERFDDAREAYEEALEIARDNGETAMEGRLHHRLARLFLKLGQAADARDHIDDGLEIARRSGDRDLEDGLSEDLGEAALRMGDVEGARESWERALTIAEQAGELRLQAVYQGRLARLAVRREDLAAAAEHAAGALEGYRAVGDRAGEVAEQTRLADIRRRQGRYGDALDAASAAVDLSAEIEEPWVTIGARCAAATVWLAMRRPETAVQLLEVALEQARHLEDATVEATVTSLLGSAIRARSLGIVEVDDGLARAAGKESVRRWRRRSRPVVEVSASGDLDGVVEAAELFASAASHARLDGNDQLFAIRRADEGICFAMAGMREEARTALEDAVAYAGTADADVRARAQAWLGRVS
jgi:tetratricopeptide (TPR) repeat protein